MRKHTQNQTPANTSSTHDFTSKALIANDADITSVVHTYPCGAVKKGVDVGVLQTQKIATVQLTPLEVWGGGVVVKVEENTNLLLFAVLETAEKNSSRGKSSSNRGCRKTH